MKILIKTVISLAIILLATGIGKKYPSLAGLIAVMPLTGALVLVWLYTDTHGDPAKMQECAWFSASSGGKLHPAGQLKSNGWGLHDMYGNVWEW